MARRPVSERSSSAQPGARTPSPLKRGSMKSGSMSAGLVKPMSAKDAIARIHAAIRAIPVGSVTGYGVVARRAGLPGRARLVARILSNNDDTTLPWHRVLRSDGRIAFPDDSDGYAEQTQRLRAEGVTVEAGRVRGMPRAADSLDALLWAPPRN